MKKSLIALAALATVTAASAQSTATISGSIAFSFQQDLTGATPSGNTSAASSAVAKGLTANDATLVVGVSEDLGGGLKAAGSVAIEAGFHRASAMTLADRSLSLSGGFGALTVRNTRSSDQMASIFSAGVAVPDDIYTSSGILARSAVDTIAFTTPAFAPGLTTTISYTEGKDGNQSIDTSNGSQAALTAGYTNGPLSLGASYKMKPQNATAVAATFTSTATTANTWGLLPKATMELSVTYDLGVAKLGYAYDGAERSGTATAVNTATLGTTALETVSYASRAVAVATTKAANAFSVTVPMGAVTFGLNYAKRDSYTMTQFGAKYDLSKRTSFSAGYGTKTAKNADSTVQTALRDSTSGVHGSQYRLRLNHTF
jgi:predicted porin